MIVADLNEELIGEGFITVIPFMEWGDESERVVGYERMESVKRVSRDGRTFQETDISKSMERAEDRLGL
jgi:hypothetical protein